MEHTEGVCCRVAVVSRNVVLVYVVDWYLYEVRVKNIYKLAGWFEGGGTGGRGLGGGRLIQYCCDKFRGARFRP